MPSHHDDVTTIREMVRQMHRAMVAANTQALAGLLTADFRLVHMTGYDQPRAEWLADITSRRMRYFSSGEDDVEVQVTGDTAWVRGRHRVNADIWGARGTWPLQLDIDLARVEGQWRMKAARASTY